VISSRDFRPGKTFSRELLSLAAGFQRRPTAREQLSGLDAVSHALAAESYIVSFFQETLAYGGPMYFSCCALLLSFVAVVLLSLPALLLLLVVVVVGGPRVTLVTWLGETRRKD